MTTSAATAAGRTPEIALPTTTLVAAVLAACTIAGGAWALGAWALGHGGAAVAGLAGAGIVAACTLGGLLAITPWVRRPVSLWISMWLGQTVLRLLVTPALTYLLYSAAPVSPAPLFVAVGLTYLAAVVSEASVLARFLQRSEAHS